ncbi:methylenetetrahydrofolate reductase [Pseudomonas putida S11]|nr:methylenetetrahydrofolate reductase [Pseudomonas putida S11]
MEFVPKPSTERFAAMDAILARAHLCGWPMTVAIGDRVGSPLDMSPLDALASFSNPVPALPHFSGKDRERHHLLAQLQRMDAAGLDQLLLLTGDRLPGHQPGQRPVRYLESVAALQIARQACPHWLLGAALNPFKYCEEEGGAQYFKAEKKLGGGRRLSHPATGFRCRKTPGSHALDEPPGHAQADAGLPDEPHPRACDDARARGWRDRHAVHARHAGSGSGAVQGLCPGAQRRPPGLADHRREADGLRRRASVGGS